MSNFHSLNEAGISGMALYVPRMRVELERWCQWTGNDWDKVQHVVGRSFRVCGPQDNVYTMASTAVLRLIEQFDVDPQRVGFLALGTESSRDNSAGAVIVRGMVDQALPRLGKPPLSRNLEVPEFKHACLAGVYALKAALRYVCSDGKGRDAIVVAGDIAQYERGSSGEQTQGAGAVAVLVQRNATMLRIELDHAGSASAYRGPDFRKPFARHGIPNHMRQAKHFQDFPVFSGKYSTIAYLDEVVHAIEAALARTTATDGAYYQGMGALFFHRPYRMMPISAMSFLLVRALAREGGSHSELCALCAKAGVQVEQVLDETSKHPDLYSAIRSQQEALENPYQATVAVARQLRDSEPFATFLREKMSLGEETVAQLGNLYSAALPAWIACGIEDAQRRSLELSGRPLLMVGYGSGDAAEVIPMSAPEGWQEQAKHIRIAEALANPIELTKAQYESMHDGRDDPCSKYPRGGEFIVSHVGARYDKDFQDLGVEYYDYVAAGGAEQIAQCQ